MIQNTAISARRADPARRSRPTAEAPNAALAPTNDEFDVIAACQQWLAMDFPSESSTKESP